MSKIKVNRLENTSTANGGIDIDTSGHVKVDGLQLPTAGPLSNRNYVGNGAFQVNQRYSSLSITPGAGSTYLLDRWRIINPSGLAPYSVQRVSTDLPTGFNYATEITLTTPATPSSSQQCFYGTAFEANELGGWKYGTADALTSTLSFYVRSSVTGTYCISLTNDANARSFVGEYTISSADTWEYKTIVIPGDTTGTWPSAGSDRHSFLQFDLGAGSNYNGTNGSWVAGNKRKTAGSVDFVSQASGSTFMLTGVQLELGSQSTSFEHECYSQTLEKCKRYFQDIKFDLSVYTASTGSYTQRYGVTLSPSMRVRPDIAVSNGHLSRLGKSYTWINSIGAVGQVIHANLSGSQSVNNHFTRMSDHLQLDAEL